MLDQIHHQKQNEWASYSCLSVCISQNAGQLWLYSVNSATLNPEQVFIRPEFEDPDSPLPVLSFGEAYSTCCFYQKLQRNRICSSIHPYLPTSPNTQKEEPNLTMQGEFSPLLTSKMPRLVAGDAEGSGRAGRPQCCE